MTHEDLVYIRRVLAAGLVAGPVLELGAGYGGVTAKELVEAAGHRYVGTNMDAGPGVDVAADFENPDHMPRLREYGPFGSVLVLNVLEHTFEPVKVLDHAAGLLRPGGTLVTITPALWPIHDWPIDVYRLLPSFYDEYARRRGLELVPDLFEYVLHGPVRGHRATDGGYAFPPPATGWRRAVGRLVHRVANTYARGVYAPPHAAIGAVFRTPG